MKRRGTARRKRKLQLPKGRNTKAKKDAWAKSKGFIDYQHYLDYKRGDEL